MVKKYAKHGPSGGERVSDIGAPTGGGAASPAGAGTPKVEPGKVSVQSC